MLNIPNICPIKQNIHRGFAFVEVPDIDGTACYTRSCWVWFWLIFRITYSTENWKTLLEMILLCYNYLMVVLMCISSVSVSHGRAPARSLGSIHWYMHPFYNLALTSAQSVELDPFLPSLNIFWAPSGKALWLASPWVALHLYVIADTLMWYLKLQFASLGWSTTWDPTCGSPQPCLHLLLPVLHVQIQALFVGRVLVPCCLLLLLSIPPYWFLQ